MTDSLKPKKPGSPSDRDEADWPLPPGIEAPLSIMQQDMSPSYFAALEAMPPSLDDIDWKDQPGVKGILFLDFDGTTHPEPADAGDSFCRLPLIAEVLREFPVVEIVISSAWRLWWPEESVALGVLGENFPEDLRPRIVGVTPDAKNLGNKLSELAPYPRERECAAWIKSKRIPGTPWLALDDRAALFRPGCPNLMLVDTDHGFMKRNLDEFRRRLWALQYPFTPQVNTEDLPESSVANFVMALAEFHGVKATRTRLDLFAEAVTRLAGDEIKLDQVGQTLVALAERKLISGAEMTRLMHSHILERKRVSKK